MARARRHRPLLPRTARVRWDPAMGWPFRAAEMYVSRAKSGAVRVLLVNQTNQKDNGVYVMQVEKEPR